MKHYVVVPSKYWSFCYQNKMKMLVEAKELLKKKEEVKLYDFGHDWILDNSTALGEEITLTEYIDLIKIFEPPIVVVPDLLNNKDKTLQRTEEFISRLDLIFPDCPSRLMMVPQGSTTTEFLECLFKITGTFDPDILGVPYRYESPYFLRSRVAPVEWALDRSLMLKDNVLPNVNKGTEIHLLGLWHPFELITGQLLGVKSNDSSLLFRCAVNGESPFSGVRDLSPDVFADGVSVNLERFKYIYREFRNFVRLLGGENEFLSDRFEQSDPDKRTIAEGSGVDSTGGAASEDPSSSAVECEGTVLQGDKVPLEHRS